MTDDRNSQSIYLSYSTFRTGVQGLAGDNGSVPLMVDKSLLGSMSGSNQVLFLAAIRELGLVDADGRPTGELRELAKADGDEAWRQAFRPVVERHFAAQLGLLREGTPTQLATSVAGEASGSVKEKAVRFLISAAEDVGLPVGSQHKKRGAITSSRPKKARKGNGGRPKPETPQEAPTNPGDLEDDPGLLSFPLYLPGKPTGRLVLPKTIDPEDLPIIEVVLQQARLYAERAASSKGGA